MKAQWSAFFTGLDDDDRHALQRTREVVALTVRDGCTRVDFRSRWDREKLCRRIGDTIDGARAAGDQNAAMLEADVSPLRRLLSDHGALNISANPRLAWFDLETDSRVRFADAVERGAARILCWSLATVRAGNAVIVARGLLEADTDDAERALITNFLEACRPYDVLMAWSGDGFDFPVLERRAAKLRVRPGGQPPLWMRWCWLDCMEVFKKYHAHVHESGDEKTSYKLQSIAHAIVGEGKRSFEVSRTWDAWDAGGEQRRRLLEYNEQDTLLMPLIELKTGYVALHVAVCSVTRCFPDSRSLMASQQGDGFLLRLGEIHGHRWPTKRRTWEDAQPYPGAFVMEPTRTGIVQDVHVADFASLYPSIMRSWNISPESILGRFEQDPPGGSCRLPHTNQVRFSRAKRGMLPRALDELVARRAEYSAKADAAEPGSQDWEHYRRLSGAYKIVANSFYGIMGSPFTRFFSSAAAEAVTQTGAYLIKHVAAASKAAGLDAFYGDTDSVFVSGDGRRFSQLVSDLNARWPPMLQELGCSECLIRLEFEKSFSRIVLISAKRYLGRYSLYKGKAVAGKIEVKGLEYKRGDTMRLSRQMQKECIDLLLGPTVPTIDQARDLVQRWQQRVLAGELTVDDVVLSQSVKALDEYVERYTSTKCTGGSAKNKCKHVFGSMEISDDNPDTCPRCGLERKRLSPPVHVRVAKILADRGDEVRAGTRIEYLITSAEGDKITAVPARDEGALALINRAYYWASRIYPPTARVLESAFPEEAWVESAADKKLRKREELVAARRKTDDLPLFACRDDRELIITLDADLDAGVDLAELKRVLTKSAGERVMRLRMVSASGDVLIPIGKCADDPSTLAAIERITGAGTVSLSMPTCEP